MENPCLELIEKKKFFLLKRKASPITYKLTPTDPSNPELPNFAEGIDSLILSKKSYGEDDFIFENQIHDDHSGTQLFNTANLDLNFDITDSNKEFNFGLDPSYLSSITATDFQSNIGSFKKNIFEPEQTTFSNFNLNNIIHNEQKVAITAQNSTIFLKPSQGIPKWLYDNFRKYATLARNAYCSNKKVNSPFSGLFLYSNELSVITFGADERNLTWELRKVNSQMVDLPGVPGAKVHNGFYQKYLKLVDKDIKRLQEKIESLPNLVTLQFNGYGIASVYAEFTAISLAKTLRRSISIEIFSFGKPRIGNEAYVKYVSSLVKSVRFTNKQDNIPREPADSKGEKYLQSGIEFWHSGVKDEVIICGAANAASGVIEEDQRENPEDHDGPYFDMIITDCDENLKVPSNPIEGFSLNSFGEWCLKRFSNDKSKILDYMQKELEVTVDNAYLDNKACRRAELLQNLKNSVEQNVVAYYYTTE
ncbi:hypothetical protein G9A89_009262 [Geosiphon pyriformis]|nr:hypothetical protein G9A89_009262 [Geosiphon pyriformis]